MHSIHDSVYVAQFPAEVRRSKIIEMAPTLSSDNRSTLESSDVCGCYFCLRTFNVSEIEEWIDNDQTALCPNCDTDTLLSDITDTDLLSAACERWFCGHSNVVIKDLEISRSTSSGVSREPTLLEVAEKQGFYSSAYKSYLTIDSAMFGYKISSWYRIDLKLRAINIVLKELAWINSHN